jgi:hypothetical protein
MEYETPPKPPPSNTGELRPGGFAAASLRRALLLARVETENAAQPWLTAERPASPFTTAMIAATAA